MSDKKRLQHLFDILMKMQTEQKRDVWDDFVKLYHPTEYEQEKLKELYKAFTEML